MSQTTTTTPTSTTTVSVPSTMPAADIASVNETINAWGRVVVSVFVLLLLGVAEVAAFSKVAVDPAILSLLQNLGVLVVGYWVGSSAGSTTKQGQLAIQSAMLANSVPAPQVTKTP